MYLTNSKQYGTSLMTIYLLDILKNTLLMRFVPIVLALILIGCGGGNGEQPTGQQSKGSLSITNTFTAGNEITAGSVIQLKASITENSGAVLDVTGSVIWSSSDNAIATISANGLLTSIKAGSVTITATYQGTSSLIKLSIFSPASAKLSAIEISAISELTAGTTQQLMATGNL